MASAEDVGKRLLGEVEECGLDEVNSISTSNDSTDYWSRYCMHSVFRIRLHRKHTLTSSNWIICYRHYPRADHIQAELMPFHQSWSSCLSLQAEEARICYTISVL